MCFNLNTNELVPIPGDVCLPSGFVCTTFGQSNFTCNPYVLPSLSLMMLSSNFKHIIRIHIITYYTHIEYTSAARIKLMRVCVLLL